MALLQRQGLPALSGRGPAPCIAGPARPARRPAICAATTLASQPIASTSSNGVGREAIEPQLAARLVGAGRDLLTSCAAATLAVSVFQLLARGIDRMREAFAAALPKPGEASAGTAGLAALTKAASVLTAPAKRLAHRDEDVSCVRMLVQSGWVHLHRRAYLAAACPAQNVAAQAQLIRKSARMALSAALPLAKIFASESLTSVYARTFERAAFGFAKVSVWQRRPLPCPRRLPPRWSLASPDSYSALGLAATRIRPLSTDVPVLPLHARAALVVPLDRLELPALGLPPPGEQRPRAYPPHALSMAHVSSPCYCSTDRKGSQGQAWHTRTPAMCIAAPVLPPLPTSAACTPPRRSRSRTCRSTAASCRPSSASWTSRPSSAS
jgi:hypothetical protein